LRGGRNGNQVEVFAERAHQDGTPKAVDGILGLTVLIEPVLEGLSGVALCGEREGDEGARDRQFVRGVEEREAEERGRGMEWCWEGR
jgi:hypothetical protein